MRLFILSLLVFATTAATAQTQRFSGTWTKVLTTYEFDFDLVLHIQKNGQVSGHFVWKAVQYDEYNSMSIEYYDDKLGLTAKEFVKGTYDAENGALLLEGYKKKDPHAIIGMDTYKLEIDDSGGIYGVTNANGSWLGRIEPKRGELELL